MGQTLPQVHFSSSVSVDKHKSASDLSQSLQGKLNLNGVTLSGKRGAIPPFDKKGLLETSGYAVSANKMISHRESSKFVKSNQDLLYVVDHDEELKKEAVKMSFQNRGDLEALIAKRAHALLEGESASIISEKDLKKQSTVASMIVLNTGGLKDIINKDSSIAEYFAGGGESIQKTVYKKLATMAKDLFPTSHPLNDEEFLSDNPRAAIYLLNHKDVVKNFMNEPDGDLEALEFKREVNLNPYKDLFEAEINAMAVDVTRLGGFNEDYFSNYDDLATFVAASSMLPDSPQASQLLGKMPNAALDNRALHDTFNLEDFLEKLVNSQVTNTLDSSVPEDILKKHFGFARLIDSSKEFRDNLKRKEDSFHLSIFVKNEQNIQLSDELVAHIQERYRPTYQDLKPAYSVLA